MTIGMDDHDDNGRCFDCGSQAPFIIFVAGEDEAAHEEWACEVHARGHWRCAVIAPSSTRHPAATVDAW